MIERKSEYDYLAATLVSQWSRDPWDVSAVLDKDLRASICLKARTIIPWNCFRGWRNDASTSMSTVSDRQCLRSTAHASS